MGLWGFIALLISLGNAEVVGDKPAEPTAQWGVFNSAQANCQALVASAPCQEMYKDPEFARLKRDCSSIDSPVMATSLYNCSKGVGGSLADALKSVADLFKMPELSPTGEVLAKFRKQCFADEKCRNGAYTLGAKKYFKKDVTAAELETLKKIPVERSLSVQPFGYGLVAMMHQWKAIENRLLIEGITPNNPEYAKRMKAESPYWLPEYKTLYQSQSLTAQAQDVLNKAQKYLNDKKEKLQCLNDETATEMVCYGVASVVDPSAAVGVVAKSKRLSKILSITKDGDRPVAVANTKRALPDTDSFTTGDWLDVENNFRKNNLSTDGLREAIQKGEPFELQGLHDAKSGPGLWLKNRADRHGIKVIIDDTQFKDGDNIVAFARGSTIYMKSDALFDVNKGLLGHELHHAVNSARCNKFGGDHCLRNIKFINTGGESIGVEMHGQKLYENRFRSDEHEAFAITHKFDKINIDEIPKSFPQDFALRQIDYLRKATGDLKNPEIVFPLQWNATDGIEVAVEGGRKVEIQIPITKTFATEEESKKFITDFLDKRLRVLELRVRASN